MCLRVPLYRSASVRVCVCAKQSKAKEPRKQRRAEEAPPNCFRLFQCLRPQRRSRRRSSSRSDNNNRGRNNNSGSKDQQRREGERKRERGESKANSKDSPRMQPTLPQAAGTADMDLTAVQSINDWFFKKEQIYLLAQFWQQVSEGPQSPHSPINQLPIAWQSIENNRTTNRAFDQSTNQRERETERESRKKRTQAKRTKKLCRSLVSFFFELQCEKCPKLCVVLSCFRKKLKELQLKFLS